MTPKKPRTIVVVWQCNGVEQRALRVVRFAPGFGHFVNWNKRAIPIDPLQDELRIDSPGPRA